MSCLYCMFVLVAIVLYACFYCENMFGATKPLAEAFLNNHIYVKLYKVILASIDKLSMWHVYIDGELSSQEYTIINGSHEANAFHECVQHLSIRL